jgi:VanZ family protein
MGSEELPRYRSAWLSLAWLLVILITIGSLVPGVPQVATGVSDKFMHFAAYAGLAFLFMGALGRRRWAAVAIGLLALGGAIELAQAFLTETRAGEWLDMAANTAGIAAGIALAAIYPVNWCRQLELAAGLSGASR